jgi:exosortase
MAEAQRVEEPVQAARTAGGNPSWFPIVWYSVLLLALFFPTIRDMVNEWIEDESMGHGFFVPAIALYIAWQRREDVMATVRRPHWTGWGLLVISFTLLVSGTLGADFFMQRIGLLTGIVGLLVVRTLAFPLLLLPFMVRIPLFIYSQITFPLQLFASQVAEHSLNMIGIPVFREGNILELPSKKLSVVEACSGIRSLLSLTFLSLAYGFFFEQRYWVRAALFVLTVPIAIAANAFRVTITGILSEYKPEMAEGAYHTFEGWVIFVVALVALVICHRMLEQIANRLEGKTPGGGQADKGGSHAGIPA